MNKREEQAYVDGSRVAWVAILQQALINLGLDSPEANANRWIVEREGAIAALRGICRQHGDNDWPEDLHLVDIMEKHLADHLREKQLSS